MASRRGTGFDGSSVVRDVISAALRSIPDYALKGVGAFLRWYFRLSMIGMLFVAAAAAVVVIIAGPAFGLNVQHGITHVIGPVVALVFVCVLLFSVIRGR
jgi:hypothetical protein